MYTKDFIFKEGIYITFQDFKNNNPPLISENFKNFNPEMDYLGKTFFLSKGFNPKKIKFPLSPDSIGEIYVDSIFGFVVDGVPYVTHDLKQENYLAGIVDGRFKLMVYEFFKIGRLCLVYPEIKEIKYNTNTTKKMISMENERPVILASKDNVDVSSAMPYKANLYILSFDTSNIYKFKLKEFSMLLEKKDKELFDEFSKFPNSKQKDMMFIYLTKLNEKHPVYFRK
jgi:hypothetical protein